MKRIVTFLTVFLLICAIPLTSFGASVSVATEISQIKTYYQEKIDLTSWEETLVFASLSTLTGRKAFYPENDGSAGALARRILAYTAAKQTPPEQTDENGNATGITLEDQLKALQTENGSFGDAETHCLAMLALSATETIYNSGKAYTYLKSLQEESGAIGGSVKATALAITVLSLSDNTEDRSAKANAAAFLTKAENTDALTVCWKIIGLTDAGLDAATVGERNILEKLYDYRNNENYTFSNTLENNEIDEQATVMALTALDAISRDSSLFKRLATDGELTLYTLEDFRPIITFAIVLLGISAAFWAFIFLHKKSTKTLSQTKTY